MKNLSHNALFFDVIGSFKFYFKISILIPIILFQTGNFDQNSNYSFNIE